MIFSGFILPDYTEASCKSCSVVYGHIALVHRFISNLEKYNNTEYLKILPYLNQMKEKYGKIYLDDFAVTYLGWIKLNDVPYKFMYLPNLEYASFFKNKYESLGYTTVNLECKFINIKNPGIFL